ncbi:hypothetical protein CALK_0285 [Chitinivibrio alkaliphilus ACht1]|uniref:Uncharacterized protein n=2 Tax=Chitinivibrio TaxID=1505231 RepID=U7D9P7_9BACT|nr:hypothetical protein CALK_0285 [Chitinivibrio alkaliphilus ACht1]
MLLLLIGATIISAKEVLPKGRSSRVQQRSRATYDRTITDRKNYNTYDHFGLVTGLLDTRTTPIITALQWRNLSIDSDDQDITSNSILAPHFMVGTPGEKYFSVYYGITPAKRTPSGAEELSTIKHDFGVSWISQAEDESFRFGFDFDGAAGRVEESTSESTRNYYHLDNLEVMMGTVIHEIATLTFSGGLSARYDSLDHENRSNANPMRDAFFDIEFPRVSTVLEIKDNLSPYKGSFGLTYARSNFVYSARNDASSGSFIPLDNTIQTEIRPDKIDDADALVTDSLTAHLKSIWGLYLDTFGGERLFSPAVELGITHASKRRMVPGSDNYPFSYNGEISGYDWRETSFSAGTGFSIHLTPALDLFSEYQFSTLNLDLTGEELQHDVDDNDGYHRFNTGFSLGIHNMSGTDFSQDNRLYIDFSFLLKQENSLNRSWYSSDFGSYITDARTESQRFRYAPWEEYQTEVRTRNIATGLRGHFNDGRMELHANAAFLEQVFSTPGEDDETTSGIALNMDLIFNIPTNE